MGLELEKSEKALNEVARQGPGLIDLSHHELFNLLVLLAAGATMLVLAPKLRIPYPILLVLGGLALGFVPGLPDYRAPPDLVLVGVLPPLLYGAAFFTSLRDLRANLRPVGLLAVGLVLADDGRRRGGRARDRPGTCRGRRRSSSAPSSRRPTRSRRRRSCTASACRAGSSTIVEGESLVNDGTALVAYRFAVVAAVSGTFSLWEAGCRSCSTSSAASRSASPSAGSCARCAGGSTSRPPR